ncbi:MAG: alpha/beta hydrolase [Gammaproteobacteria bacterium]|nr:alpha/beta hydrolase [Gammaproteobacteria bacterium]
MALPPDIAIESLEAWLTQKEAGVAGVKAGTEKIVRWRAPGTPSRAQTALVYIHGFSASRQETSPLAEIVAEAISANVFYTRLSGHGIGGDALLEANCAQWSDDADEALAIGRLIGQRTIVMATSTGASLALHRWFAGTAADVAAFVLLSPNLALKHRASSLLRTSLAPLLVRLVVGKTYSFPPVNERHGRFWTTSYPSQALIEMYRLVNHVNAQDWRRFDAPFMMLANAGDRLVDPAVSSKFFEQASSRYKQFEWLDNTTDPQAHVLAGDILSPHTTEVVASRIIEFIRQIPP